MPFNLPAEYHDKSGDNRYFNLSSLSKDEEITLRPCGTFEDGHWIHGFVYWVDGQPKRSPVKPLLKDYIDEIDYKFGHGPGKTRYDEKAKKEVPAEDKKSPDKFVSFPAICKERKNIVVVTIDKPGVLKDLEQALAREDTALTPDGLLNIKIIFGRPEIKPARYYSAHTVQAKPTPGEITNWKKAKDTIWTQALFSGSDPFAGKPADASVEGLPPTSRDELGADKEISDAMPDEGWG